MPHPFRLYAALLFVAALAACEPPTGKDPDPEPRLPSLAVGTPVNDRVDAGAADEYALVAPQGEFRVLLRAASGNAADSLVATVMDAAGHVVGAVRSVGTDTDVAAQATGWLTVPAGAQWRVTVRGAGPDDAGAYALQLFPRSTAPESVPAAITVGSAVEGEALDVAGDVDEFTLEGSAGQEWIVFAQALGAENTFVDLELVERGSGETVARVQAQAPTEALEARSSGRVLLTRTGSYLLRVSATIDPFREMRGPYRLRVDAVNRAPEAGSGAVALGAVVAEAIGSVGDVDEYTFNAPAAGQEMNLLVQLQQGMAPGPMMNAGLRVELLRGGQKVAEVVADTPTASLDDRGTGRITLPAAGAYTVRVSGPAAGTPATATGTYRLELYPVDRRAEAGGEIRLDGATVTGAIDRPGDVDEYELPGTAGQLVVVHAIGTPVRTALQAELLAPDGTVVGGAVVSAGATPNYGRRHRLPATGTYRLRVAAVWAGHLGSGPFTIGAYTVDPAPEHVPATLTLGQTVTAERIDRPGDLDVFTFTGQAGRTASLFVGKPEDVGGIVASVRTAAQQYPIIFTFAGTMTLDGRSTGRIPLENTGYVVTVDPQHLSGDVGYAESGAYALRLFEIDRRPEGRAAAYVLGDTVKAEVLYPSGDIDEYTFELGASTPVRLWWNAVGSDPSNAVFGHVRSEDTGEIVYGVVGGNQPFTRQFTLPAGRYRFVVQNTNLEAPSETAQSPTVRLPYRFAIVRQ